MSHIVYSTEKGSICPECGQPVASCRCHENSKKQILGTGKVRVRRELKGRGGKAVTVITGLAKSEEELRILARELKQRLGVGGAVKNGNIEIQGDRVTPVLELLRAKGIEAKKGGG